MQVATLWHVTLRAVQDWWNDNCLRLEASLAYYTALSLAPLLLLLVGLTEIVLGREQVGHQLTAQLEGLIGPSGRELVTSILAATNLQEDALATSITPYTLTEMSYTPSDPEALLHEPVGPVRCMAMHPEESALVARIFLCRASEDKSPVPEPAPKA